MTKIVTLNLKFIPYTIIFKAISVFIKGLWQQYASIQCYYHSLCEGAGNSYILLSGGGAGYARVSSVIIILSFIYPSENHTHVISVAFGFLCRYVGWS